MSAFCRECGGPFEPKADWMKLCWPCWRERKDREVADKGYQRGYDDGYDAGVRAGQTRRNGHARLDASLLREAIQLCHPDRHPAERFDQANRVTAQLVAMREGK